MSERKVAGLEAVIDQTRALFHRLKAVAQEIHRKGPGTAGLRGVLQDLSRSGPRTVPDMARARPVSRQHIQVLVNQLLELGFVELADNPAHKRSKLVALTDSGREALAEIRRTEAKLLTDLPVDVTDSEVEHAAAVLERIRIAFEQMPSFHRDGSSEEREE